MADDYLNGSVKDILEPMISALLMAQPEDPQFFMLHWLKNLYSLDYIVINKEKEELENLRLEIKGYKAKKNEVNKPNENLEELKSKINDKPNDNEIKSNKENDNDDINNENNINNLNINNEKEKENQKEIEESKIESKNENDNIDNENNNDLEPKKDLIDFSEESEN